MRNTRKWLVLLLTVVMLVNTLGVTAMAAGNESPIALQAVPAAGSDSQQVRILATQAQTVADGKLVVTYDADALTYTGTETGDAWGEDAQVTLSVNPTEGKVILAFANADAAATGVLFTLTFTGSGESIIAIDGSSYITGVQADLAQSISTCPSAHLVDVQDIPAEYHDAVDFMVANGYMEGVSNTMFAPTMELNRAMMVTILYRIAGEPDVEGAPAFRDVPADVYCADAVVWASANDITNGISEHLFAPTKSLTRVELVTFLYRFATYMGYDVTATTDLSRYDDASQIPAFALEGFSWAVAEGIVKGTSETTLDPMATTNRIQICLMVCRLLSEQD